MTWAPGTDAQAIECRRFSTCLMPKVSNRAASTSLLELLSHQCWVSQLAKEHRAHIDTDLLTAVSLIFRICIQSMQLHAKAFLQHRVEENFRDCWNIGAVKLCQTSVCCLGYFRSPLSCNQQSAITLVLTNHAKSFSQLFSLSLSLS